MTEMRLTEGGRGADGYLIEVAGEVDLTVVVAPGSDLDRDPWVITPPRARC